MNTVAIIPSMLYILPELFLLLLTLFILILDLTLPKKGSGTLGWIAAIGFLAAGGLGVAFGRPPESGALLFGGMLRADWSGFILRFLFLAGGAVTALLITDNPTRRYGEFLALLIISVFGMSLMTMSSNMLMLYLAIETTSLPLYVLSGFRIHDQKSVEAGIKYLLFGALASAFLLYGLSLLWGFTGNLNFYQAAFLLQSNAIPSQLQMGVFALVFAGLAFKISAAPFHFWAPDVYEGAPTPVAGFLSTASKAAGFAVLVRLAAVSFPAIVPYWTGLVGLAAAASMILGNFLALWQRNIKRLLAYSSIAQAGYMLLGLAANSDLGRTGVIYYLMGYLFSNLAVFGVIWLVGRETGSDDLEAYQGLGRRNPVAAVVMLIGLLSLGGIPPLAGFVSKLLVFAAAVQTGLAGQGWLIGLAFLGALTSVVGLYYYLNVMKVLYKPAMDATPVPSTKSWATAVVVCAIMTVALGVIIAPLFGWGMQSAVTWLK